MNAPSALQRRSTAEQAAEVLRERLLAGELAPGTPMRDAALAAELGVARSTMREALALLARDGLLVHALHRGMEVVRLEADDVARLFETRRVLEGAAAREPRTATHRAPLVAAVDAMAAAARRGDAPAVVEADLRLHTALVAGLGLPRLTAAHRGALEALRLALTARDRAARDAAAMAAAHRRLVDDLGHRLARVRVAAVERHLADAEAALLEELDA